jgi:Fe-S-cluster containining protein
MSCLGKCCALFTYTSTPEELREKPWKGDNTQRDNLYIADMLIQLTPEEAQERAERFDTSNKDNLDYTKVPWYTCKHWDEDTMLCGAYEDRPRMCRDFPYGNVCAACDYELPTDLLGAYERKYIDNGFITNIVLGEN